LRGGKGNGSILRARRHYTIQLKRSAKIKLIPRVQMSDYI